MERALEAVDDPRDAWQCRVDVPVGIAAGMSLTKNLDFGPGLWTLSAVIIGAAWTAADITFEASIDGVNYYPVYDALDALVTLAVGTDHYTVVNVSDFASIRYLRLRSGTPAAPVAQAAKRSIHLVVRPV